MDVPDLDPVIHQPVRLRILAALNRNRQASFTSLRDGLRLTDGNLATHAGKLEAAGYVTSRRVLSGTRFELRYRITPDGARAFHAYAEALRTLLAADAADDVDAGDAAAARGAQPDPV